MRKQSLTPGTAVGPRNRVRVRTRLLAAIVVPLLVLSAVSWRSIDERRSDLHLAQTVVSRLERLTLLTELRSSLFAERLAAEILVPSRAPDPEILAAITAFGRILIEDPASLEERTDAALAAVGPQDRPFLQPELDQARADRATWSSSIPAVSERLGPFYDRTIATMLQLAESVRIANVEIGDAELVRAGTTFQRSIALPGAAAETLRSITDLFLGEPERRPGLQSDTAAAAAVLEELSARFASTLVEPATGVTNLWRSSQLPDDLRQALIEAGTGALTSPARPPLEPASLGTTLLAGIDWLVSVDQLPSVAAAEMRDSARGVVVRARESARDLALLTAGLLASSLLVAVALARSIVAPVRRLTDQAHQVGSGNLDLEPLPLRGPPDVVAACAAMNDVVDNLALMRRKAIALADGQLTDPVMLQSLPGPLGAELQRSADQLTTNLSEWQELRSQLVHDAAHDSLTGLANRSALLAFLGATGAPGRKPSMAVIFIDLSQFKRINDMHGHAAGDRLLSVVAARLVNCTPPSGLVSRWGGDEFVIALPDTTGAEALALSTGIVEALGQPLVVDGSNVRIAACAGIAATGQTTITDAPWSDDLLRQADFAVYHAKSLGPGSVALFDEELGQRIRTQDQVSAALLAALCPTADELFLVFQPIINARTGNLVGMEALIRWRRPEHGLIQPDDFIPIAERSDLIIELDQWVLQTALHQLDCWTKQDLFPDAIISVNVSARSLRHADFIDTVTAALVQYSVAPKRLMLEITETALITDIDHASAQLHQLRALGVSIAIDDFGTGFTSVSQLRNMPVDELKIDKSFVQALDSGDNLVLVRMINDLAHHLDIPTVAEGIETIAERDLMTEIGCDALQGYLFSRPLDPIEFARQASLGAWGTASART